MRPKEPVQVFVSDLANVFRKSGFVRKGRSRLWSHDLGWLIVNIELQPSSWSKGSYLNVGPQILFRGDSECGALSFRFELGFNRLLEFHSIQTEEDVASCVTKFRTTALDAVDRIVASTGTIRKAVFHLESMATKSPYDLYSGSVLYGLCGETSKARQMLTQLSDRGTGLAWLDGLKADAKETIGPLIQDRDKLISLVTKRTACARQSLRLPEIAETELECLIRSQST